MFYVAKSDLSNISNADFLNKAIASGLSGYNAVIANYTILITDYTINVTANSVILTLPSAIGILGKIFVLKNSGAGLVSVNTFSSQTIDGQSASLIKLNIGDSVTVQSTGANWIIIGAV